MVSRAPRAWFSATAIATGTGKPGPARWNCASPSCARDTTFRAFWRPGGWPRRSLLLLSRKPRSRGSRPARWTIWFKPWAARGSRRARSAGCARRSTNGSVPSFWGNCRLSPASLVVSSPLSRLAFGNRRGGGLDLWLDGVRLVPHAVWHQVWKDGALLLSGGWDSLRREERQLNIRLLRSLWSLVRPD